MIIISYKYIKIMKIILKILKLVSFLLINFKRNCNFSFRSYSIKFNNPNWDTKNKLDSKSNL